MKKETTFKAVLFIVFSKLSIIMIIDITLIFTTFLFWKFDKRGKDIISKYCPLVEVNKNYISNRKYAYTLLYHIFTWRALLPQIKTGFSSF